jgi:methionyl-tRNA formyltransferase
MRYNLPVLQPAKLKAPAFLEPLHELRAELFVVVAFRMLPEEVWQMPPLGTINLHASLLPQYRGAAPINWAIINGETRSGTTVFFIDREIDRGHIISHREEAIAPSDDASTLHDRLMHSGATHLTEAIQTIASNSCHALPQDSATQTLPLKGAPKIFRETCKIHWNSDVEQLHNLIRGLSPIPAAWTVIVTPKGERLTLKIYKSTVQLSNALPDPGTIDTDHKTSLRVAAQGGWLVVHSLQLEGKKRMNITDFLRGAPQMMIEKKEMQPL